MNIPNILFQIIIHDRACTFIQFKFEVHFDGQLCNLNSLSKVSLYKMDSGYQIIAPMTEYDFLQFQSTVRDEVCTV